MKNILFTRDDGIEREGRLNVKEEVKIWAHVLHMTH